jgi:hypothetical protein
MTDQLKERMARLREIAPRLNSATDQASRLVAMVEKFLAEELHIGIATESSAFNSWSAGKDEADRPRVICQSLAFGRIGAVFRIHVVDETRIMDDNGSWCESVARVETPWPACGRETKLRAFEKLPELLDNIIKETERLAETAASAAVKVGAMTGESAAQLAAPAVAPQVLSCPSCCEKGKWLNVGPSHWCVCADCEVKWPIGTNLLPSWQNETEEDWERNAKLLARYSEEF